MKEELLDRAVDLAKRVGYATLATSDDQGMPHVAAVGRLHHPAQGHLAVEEWFCPGTLANLTHHGSKVSIVAWDPESDTGYQVLGRMEDLLEEHVMDGYVPGQRHEMPQVARRLVVQVEEILIFSKAPHRDQPAEVEP